MPTRKRSDQPKTGTKTTDIFGFRDMIRERISEDYKSFRAFALENEKTIGYQHSSILLSLSSNKRRPSAKVLHAIAKVLKIKFDKKREIVETYTYKA